MCSAVSPDRQVGWHHLALTALRCLALILPCGDKGLVSDRELTPGFQTGSEQVLLGVEEKKKSVQVRALLSRDF